MTVTLTAFERSQLLLFANRSNTGWTAPHAPRLRLQALGLLARRINGEFYATARGIAHARDLTRRGVRA